MTDVLVDPVEVHGYTLTADELLAALPTPGALLWDIADEANDQADAATELAARLRQLHAALDAGPDAVREVRKQVALDVLELADALRAFAIRVVSE